MICRELQPEDVIPWTVKEMGWDPAQLDRETVWVAIDESKKIIGMVIAAKVHRSLLILRMLGKGGAWVRPLWRYIRHACFQRHVESYWTFTDNSRDVEARLIKLLLKGGTIAFEHTTTLTVVGGRWNAVSGNDTVASPLDYWSSRSRLPGGDGLHASERAILLFLQQQCDGSGSAGEAAGSSAGSSPENRIPGSAAQRTGADGRGPHIDGVQYGGSDSSGGSIRSKLYRTIFGPEYRDRDDR
jgi:hypothetical protein